MKKILILTIIGTFAAPVALTAACKKEFKVVCGLKHKNHKKRAFLAGFDLYTVKKKNGRTKNKVHKINLHNATVCRGVDAATVNLFVPDKFCDRIEGARLVMYRFNPQVVKKYKRKTTYKAIKKAMRKDKRGFSYRQISVKFKPGKSEGYVIDSHHPTDKEAEALRLSVSKQGGVSIDKLHH